MGIQYLRKNPKHEKDFPGIYYVMLLSQTIKKNLCVPKIHTPKKFATHIGLKTFICIPPLCG